MDKMLLAAGESARRQPLSAQRSKPSSPRKLVRSRHLLVACGLAGGFAAPAAGQLLSEQREIVVTGQRSAILENPERTVGAMDVSSYGLGTIGELIDEIASEEGSGASGVAVLVNGQLTSDRSSIDDYPVESVERIEILRPGAAGPRGGSSTARAINVVLRPVSRVLAVRGAARAATDGGWTGGMGDLGLTAIERPRRFNLTTRVSREGALLESERDIIQVSGTPVGAGRFRSLRGDRERIDVGLAGSDQLAPWLTGSINVKLTRGKNRARLGLSPTGNPLVQEGETDSVAGDLQLQADRGDWQFALEAAVRNDSQRIGTRDVSLGRGRRPTRSTSRNRSIEVRANGPIMQLPAGEMRFTVNGSADRVSIEGESSGVTERFDQSTYELRVGLDVPLTSRTDGSPAPFGDLGIGAEIRRGRVSGFDSTSSNSITLRWEPTDWLRIFGAWSSSQSSPSADLLAATPIETPGVRYFDPIRGETVDVVTVSGGNPTLGKFRVDSGQLSVRLKPFRNLDLIMNSEYSTSETRNVIAILPPASDAVVDAFPERFVRDFSGGLVAVDLRPVRFDRQSQTQLRNGFNLTLPLGGKGRDERRRRLQLTATHSLLLSSKLIIGEGGPTVDLLSRQAAGFGGATQPRHQVDLAIGYAERGLGVRFSAERRNNSFLDLAGAASGDVLTFESSTTVAFRAFAEASRLLPSVGWLKGGRFAMTIVNLTNDREVVRDRSGLTPLSYQPGYRDPLGRTVEVEFRKTF